MGNFWQRLRGIEHRQEGGAYSAAVIALLQAQAGGSTALPGATAALECASGFVSRAFASAEIKTDNPIMAAALDPVTLATIGRELIRRGEYVAVLKMDMQSDSPRLAPATTWDIVGHEDPKTWVYRLVLAGPTQQATIELPASGVIHIKYAVDASAKHRGIGPIASASLAGRLSAETIKALGDEQAGPRGQLLPLPSIDGADPAVAALRGDIKNLNGGLAFIESQAGAFGTDRSAGASGQSGWDIKRVGASPEMATVEVARLAFAEVLAACGMSVALFDDSQGTGKREAFRQALHQVCSPLGRIAATELTAKLETQVTFDWSELRAADIAGRARAFRTMVEAGLSLSEAAGLSGIMIE